MSMSASEYLRSRSVKRAKRSSFFCYSLVLSIIPYFSILAFKLLESSSQQWLQGLVYLVGNLLASALAIYKCQSMGLLPTHSSDWLAFIEPPQVSGVFFFAVFYLFIFFCYF